MARTRGPSVQKQLLQKSREAALNAVQTFNNPLTMFKTESFIVLMVVAWTYLLHAYFRSKGVDYRYYQGGPKRRRFARTRWGAFKYWELERCLTDSDSPLDQPTRQNLRFLIGLRNEIEHHQSAGIDEAFTGRYIACCLNYERELTRLFGLKYSLASHLSYALQLRDITSPQYDEENASLLPSNVAKYISQFDAELPAEDYQHPHFSYRLLFVRKLTSKQGQADKVVEFIGEDSELAKTIDKEFHLLKEVERPKYLPSNIVKLMQSEGFTHFKMHNHTELWKHLDAKNLGKGYGVEVAGTWYWYERWVDEVRNHCAANKQTYSAKLTHEAA